VDWICTFAYLLVAQEEAIVTLAGAVMKDTKEKWEAIYNSGAAMTAIFSTPTTSL
jgi:hypothetical protein